MDLSNILTVFERVPAITRLEKELGSGRSGLSVGVLSGGKAPLTARLFQSRARVTLLITGRVDAVPVWLQALEAWLPIGSEMVRFPEPTPLPYERGPWSELSRNSRLWTLSRLMLDQHPFVEENAGPILILTSARALLQRTLPKRRFVANSRSLQPGHRLLMDNTAAAWQAIGYEHVSVVESPGQYSRRGGILDIYPLGNDKPARIELFGDQIETIRFFDPATQRAVDPLADDSVRLIIPPAREVLPADAKPLGSRLEAKVAQASGLLGWSEDIGDLMRGVPTPHLEFYLPMVYENSGLLLDYLPEDALIVMDDPDRIAEAAADLHQRASEIAAEQDGPPPGYPNPLYPWKEIEKRIESFQYLTIGGDDHNGQNHLTDVFEAGPRYGGQIRPLLAQLRLAMDKGEKSIVVSRQAQRLAELWREDRSTRSSTPGGSLISERSEPRESEEQLVEFVQGSLSSGFTLELEESPGSGTGTFFHLLTDAEIFGWNRPVPRRRSRPRPVAPETFYSDIHPGDYVVHVEYGIGRFKGLVIRAIGGMEREYLQVNFANGDVLYVPVHHADRISRWIGPDDRKPKLHRLGGRSWKKTTSQARQAVDRLADELLDLYAAREEVPGHAFAKDTHWQAELEAGFSYRESEDQLRAIAEVKADMERPYPMDRLVTGDVGYGKTEVALRAAFKAVMDGKQVAILVPTTVLAQQHYKTFCDRLDPFPVRVEMLSRFRTVAQQETIVKHLRAGQVDIVIGTHRLFSDDVSFKDLGLLIIDEEQRFGVSHKERLKQLRKEVDVLTMTATPIPRTLYMSLTGVRDISIIDTAPADRLPVQTYVGLAEEGLIRRAILREIDRGGQVFYVHNRVQTIHNIEVKLANLVPEVRIAIGHGQMSERQLEDVMVRFVDGEIDVLLTTTIIESGLDIPNANTLIVERADQFGLAQLYQLRGRVGRGIRRAYAYFLHPKWRRLTADAKTRLEVIEAQTELGSGYTIALRDLEIRGAGDLLGARQSGHIAAVGFDLYTRLLAQAVRERKVPDEERPSSSDLGETVFIDLPLPAYVPTDYVPEASLRLRLYRRMAVIDTMKEIDEMAAELADRFGKLPDPVKNLLYQLRIKVLAQRASIPAVASESGQVQIKLPSNGRVNRINLQKYLGHEVRVSRKGIWLPRGLATREWQISLVQILERLEMLSRQGKAMPLSPTSSG